MRDSGPPSSLPPSSSARRRRPAARARAWLILAALLACDAAHAQPFEALGTRALGMAGAFVAVADDATAVYWNPAGLTTGDFLSLLVDHADAGPSGAGTIAALSTNEIAFSYYRLRVAGERPLVTHNVAISGASFAFPGVSFGTTLRYVRGAAGLAPGGLGSLAAIGGRHLFDLDAGVMAGSETVRVGLVARNLREPSLEAPGGGRIRLQRQFRAGVALRTEAGLLVSADLDLGRARPDAAGGARRNAAVGAEYWLADWLAVRGGARANLEAEALRPVGALGLSVALTSGVYLDGQLTRGRDTPERGWSIAARVGF